MIRPFLTIKHMHYKRDSLNGDKEDLRLIITAKIYYSDDLDRNLLVRVIQVGRFWMRPESSAGVECLFMGLKTWDEELGF